MRRGRRAFPVRFHRGAGFYLPPDHGRLKTCPTFEPGMTLRISDVRLSVDEPEAHLPERLAAVLGVAPGDLLHWRILRKSLDARDKDALQFVYTAEVAVPDEEKRLAGRAGLAPSGVDRYEEEPFLVPPPGTRPLPHRPVVIGSGPGGLAAAWFLAEQGYRPLVLERGRAVRDRIRDVSRLRRRRAVRPRKQLPVRRGRRRHIQRRQTHLPQQRPRRAPHPATFRREQGQAVGAVRRPAAPRQQPFAGRRQGAAAPRRGAGRRGALLPAASRTSTWRTAGCAAWRRRPVTSPQRRRSWRSATAPATPTRCCCAAACRWSASRFSWACASSIRRRRSTA